MAEPHPRERQQGEMGDAVVKINRTAKVVKGGRRFGFSALVVVGDRAGRVGWGFGKANIVPSAVEKATKYAHRNIYTIRLEGDTIAHAIEGRFSSSRVLLMPARPGTGLVAGGAVRTVLEMAGIRNILSKAYGSTNPVNLLKATFQALESLRSRREIEELRTQKIEEPFHWGRRRVKAWI